MLRKGGIYKIKDKDSYIIIIERINVLYYYNILNGCTGFISNEEMKEHLTRQIDYGLGKQHKFFAKGKESKITELVDGYLGQVTDQQLFALSVELSFIDFSQN